MNAANIAYQIGLGLLKLLSRLPYAFQYRLGLVLGEFAYRLMVRRRAIAKTNIELCFPELDSRARQRLLRQHFHSIGISIFEVGLCWWGDSKKLEPLCHIEGLDHLKQALSAGKGVILLSAHFTSLEIGGRLLSLHHPFAVMYKPQRNPVLEQTMRSSRQRHFEQAIVKSDLRGLLRVLKSGMACWYAADQDPSAYRAVFAPFFGIPAATTPAPSRFAKLSGAKVLPFFTRRREKGAGYDLTIFPPLQDFPSDDPIADATRINQIIEQQVRKAPEQYLWLHRRFKTRPPGQPSVYDS